MPTYDPDGIVLYAKMLEDRCAEMAKVIRALTPLDQLPVRKMVSFETAEYIYSPQEK